MCSTSITSKRHKKHVHPCQIKIFKCRSHQLCVFSFLFYCTTCGIFCNAYHVPVNKTEPYEDLKTVTTDSIPVDVDKHDSSTVTSQQKRHHSEMVQCNDSGCYVKISSSKQALENMMSVTLQLYKNYASSNESEEAMTVESFKNLLQNLKPKEKVPEPNHAHNHDHGSEIQLEEQVSEPISDEELNAIYAMYYGFPDDHNDTSSEANIAAKEIPCYGSVKDLTEAYFNSSNEHLQLSFGDFITLLPQIVLDITRPGCEESNHGDSTEEKSAIKPSAKYVWLISFGSVTVISVVSLCGVLTIPLLRYSKVLNHLLAYLVALAVGTLCGDALLHLLPRAAGMHDHGSEAGNESDHFDFMWKGLVVCAGIYFFFLLETIIGFIHKRKEKSNDHKKHSHCHDNGREHECDVESASSDETRGANQGNSTATPSDFPLLKSDSKYSNEGVHITTFVNGVSNCTHGEHDSKPDGHIVAIKADEEPLDTGHHHHHHSNEVPKTIASLAWMVIVGDGLHNITDGLAIGAAFTSSIGAGLGTVLAIFFHEIPQELADFAVLLNAGMTVRQALVWNFLSACTCFVGLVIGLVVGEYTNGIILWILAFTAGGFLYIALVDMLPALMKQLTQKGYKLRFFIQNAGMLSGFGMMVLIALKEDTFESYFR